MSPLLFKKILFIYSWETHRERQRHRQREKQAPCRESDEGLDPRTLGSPEPKADTQPLSHPGALLPLLFALYHLEKPWDDLSVSQIRNVSLSDICHFDDRNQYCSIRRNVALTWLILTVTKITMKINNGNSPLMNA